MAESESPDIGQHGARIYTSGGDGRKSAGF